MSRIKHEAVERRLEHAVQSKRQLDNAEIRAEVSSCARHRLHQVRADLFSKVGEFLRG